jgi:hypothetical protein
VIDTFWGYTLYSIWLYGMGVVLGYIWWAPTTAFKQAFMDGLTFGPVVRYIRQRIRPTQKE